jgi:hypothetical protein
LDVTSSLNRSNGLTASMNAPIVFQSPPKSRIRSVPFGKTGLHILIPMPNRGVIAGCAMAFSFVLVPALMAKMFVGQLKINVRPIDAWVWFTGVIVFAGSALAVIVVNWIWPHVRHTWFRRVNIVVEPGRIAVRQIGPFRKWDLTTEFGRDAVARLLQSCRDAPHGAVEVVGVSGAARCAEVLSASERDWLVDIINHIHHHGIAAAPQANQGMAHARRTSVFDPFQVAKSGPVVIDENHWEEFRCHFAPHRGLAIWIVATMATICSVGLLYLFTNGGDLQRAWNAVEAGGSIGAAVLLGVMLLIALLPALLGLWLVAGRRSIALAPGELIFRRHLGPLGFRRRVPWDAIESITTLAYADRKVAIQIARRARVPDSVLLKGCVVRHRSGHLVLSDDKEVDGVLRSLLRGKLDEWGVPVSED